MCCCTSRSASSPLAAEPTTSKVGLRLQQRRQRLAQDRVIVGDNDGNSILRHPSNLDAQESRSGMRYSG